MLTERKFQTEISESFLEMVNNPNVTLFTFHKNYMTKKNIPSILASGEKEMENFRSWALDLVDLLESP